MAPDVERLIVYVKQTDGVVDPLFVGDAVPGQNKRFPEQVRHLFSRQC